MKKFLLPIIILAIIVVLFVVIKTVDFGRLTIQILEKRTGALVEFDELKGNILSGFQLENYKVKLSAQDSIYGMNANIRYRFNPFSFRLPASFEIYLLKPRLDLKRVSATKSHSSPELPHLSLGLRINLKDGRFRYRNEKTYEFNKISGLIFIDFLETRVLVNTMNLSWSMSNYPVDVHSANINLQIDKRGIYAKKFKVKGVGILCDFKATYSKKDNQIALNINRAEFDLKRLGIYKGRIIFKGALSYHDGLLLPRLQGRGESVYPFEYFKFETTNFGDTICANIFDGHLLGGTLFAQINFLTLQDFKLEMNFREVDFSKLTNYSLPLRTDGTLIYQNKKFFTRLNSPPDSGLDIDSMFIYGKNKKPQMTIDSLIVYKNENRILQGEGEIYKKVDMKFIFNRFSLQRFSKFYPLNGSLSGKCHITTDIKNLKDFSLSLNIDLKNLFINEINFENLLIKANDLSLSGPGEYLEIDSKRPGYKNFQLDNCHLLIMNHDFWLDAQKGADRLSTQGTIDKGWRGEIASLNLNHNNIQTNNTNPISFDCLNREIGDIALRFIDGQLKLTPDPLTFHLIAGNLEKLGELLGLKPKITGSLDMMYQGGRLLLNSEDINFLGLKDGVVNLSAVYRNKGLVVDSLTVSDKKGQQAQMVGILSFEKSNFKLKFNDLGVWIFPFLNNFLKNPYGLICGEVNFAGNLKDFKLAGDAIIKDSGFGVDMISDQFDSLSGTVKFIDNKIVFSSAQAQVSPEGIEYVGKKKSSASATGWLKLEPNFRVENYHFDFSFKDAPIQFLPFAYGIGSGNFSLARKDKIMYYNGDIDVREAIVPIDFGMQLHSGTSEEKDSYRMNITLSGERNIWLRNREADIEFGGEVYIVKKETPLYISGNLETKRGNFYWLNHTLSVSRGNIAFIPEDRINPDLDIWAELPTQEGVKIILHCFGPISEPIFEFFSEPPIYSEQDILTYLNLNITWKELESLKQGEYMGKILPRGIVSWLESDISRRIREYTKLDYFQIKTPLFQPTEKTKLTVGKYISRNLFVTYTYDITTFSNEFNVEYFIDDQNEILIRRDETGEYGLQYQYRIRF